MSQVLNKIHDLDPTNNDAVKETLSSFFQNLPKHVDLDSNRWLRVLENVINRFPKFCGTHRNTIETHLAYFINSNNYFNVIEAAKCAHALQQVRPSQEKAGTPKACWREHMIILCNAANIQITSLFPNSVDMYKGSDNATKPQQLQSSNSSPFYAALKQQKQQVKTQNNNMDKQHVMSTRLNNTFVFLQAMLVEIYPVAKPVQPQVILEVIVRALSVSSSTKTNLDPKDIAAIKIQALRTLDALIACLGSNLIPFSALIFRFVMQTLKWTTDNNNEDYRKVRISAYSTLSRWLRCLASHRLSSGRARCWEQELATHLAGDVTPARHHIQLTMSAQPTRHMSKKAKRKLNNAMLRESSIAAHMPGEKNKLPVSDDSNDEVTVAALGCLETLFIVCGIFLKPATHKLFQERIVRECYNLHSYPVDRGLHLLRVLEALRKTTPPTVPPPTQYCLQLYSVLVNNGQEEVSTFCSHALLDIRLHLHCSPPSLNFAIEVQETEKNAPEKRKNISEKNRAALEALLGKEKMPDETDGIVDEVIDIADEPSAKKVRLSTELDRISLSSESNDSIVINDDSDDDVVMQESIIEEEQGVETEGDKVIEKQVEEVSNEEIQFTQAQDKLDPSQSSQENTNNKDKLVIVDKEDPAEHTENAHTELENDVTDAAQAAKEYSPDATVIENIYEATTQIPLIASSDTADGDRSPVSMEVAYDFPNTSKDKVTVLEKTEDENLPSTSDTDDIQITCGQMVKSSQDIDAEKNKEEGKENIEPKVNGDKSPEKVVNVSEGIESVADETADKCITVDDMFADFVDEVNEEVTAETLTNKT